MAEIRLGYVSAYNEAQNKASVFYPDRSGQTTKMFDVLAPLGLKQQLKKGDQVLVAHLSNGTVNGFIIAAYASPLAGAKVTGGLLSLYDTQNNISLTELTKLEKRVTELEKKV